MNSYSGGISMFVLHFKCLYQADIYYRQIFSNQMVKCSICMNSALSKIKEKQVERQALENKSQNR